MKVTCVSCETGYEVKQFGDNSRCVEMPCPAAEPYRVAYKATARKECISECDAG